MSKAKRNFPGHDLFFDPDAETFLVYQQWNPREGHWNEKIRTSKPLQSLEFC